MPIDDFLSQERVVVEQTVTEFSATETKLQADYEAFVETLTKEIAFEEEQRIHLEDLEGMLDESVVAATRMATEALDVKMNELIDQYKGKVLANNAFASEIHTKSKQSIVDIQEIKDLMKKMDAKMKDVASFIQEYHTHLSKVSVPSSDPVPVPQASNPAPAPESAPEAPEPFLAPAEIDPVDLAAHLMAEPVC